MAADSFCCGYVPHTNALTHVQTGMHLSSVAQLFLAPRASDPEGGSLEVVVASVYVSETNPETPQLWWILAYLNPHQLKLEVLVVV